MDDCLINDKGEFKSLLIVDPNNELSLELNKDSSEINKRKFVELVTSNLGSTRPQLENLLDFEEACFNQSVYFAANFSTSVSGAKDNNTFVFQPYIVVSFRDCRIDGELAFYGISPKETPETETALPKYLRLTGCVYKRIEADSVAISDRIKKN